MRIIIFLVFLSFLFNQKSFASIIKYEEILDNPTDLELNLNYAKQQEKNGNVKSTIATLERLSMLYPQNSDIKLYLLSILLKMDSEVKVNLMVKTMLNDPNTTQDTRDIIAGLLTNKKTEEKKEEKQKKQKELEETKKIEKDAIDLNNKETELKKNEQMVEDAIKEVTAEESKIKSDVDTLKLNE